MSVPIVKTENIPPVQTAPDIKAENAYVNGTNIDVIATEDTGAVDEKAWIRELCKVRIAMWVIHVHKQIIIFYPLIAEVQ